MNTKDIISLKDELVGRDAARIAKYDLIMQAVGGNYTSRRLEGFWESWQEITGRRVPMDRETFEFRLNLLPSLISSQRSFIGTIPSLQCPPSGPITPDDAGKALKEKAEKLERVYAGIWNYSHIGKCMNKIGYWNPTLGTTIGLVWPDVDNQRPVLQMRSPYGCYPVLADTDGQELSQVIFNTTYKARQVAAMYPSIASKLSGDEAVDVTQYMDKSSIVTIVDGTFRTQDIVNKWGFVPVVMIPNDAFGEGPWGDGALEWVIPMQEEHNYRESLKSAILEQTIMQPLAIEGGENLPAEIPMGPRDAIPVQMGGRVYRVNPVQVPYQYLQSQSELIAMIDRVGQLPQVMQGNAPGSVVTGRAVSTLMGPTQMAFNVKGNEIYPAISTLNKMAMRMWHAMWPRKAHTVYSMDTNGQNMSVESFKTGEFGGWYENIVYVDSASYFDAQSRFVMVLQSVQNRLMSRQTAMQFVPGVSDPVAETALIKSELADDMALQQGAQAFAQSNPQPNMAEPAQTSKDLQKGYMGQTPPPEAIGAIPTPKPGETPPPEQGGLLQDMTAFFDSIPLHGKVWLAGGIVTDPSYSPESPSYNGIEVFLSDPNDKAAINTKMRTEYPKMWGHIVYHSGEPSSDEPSILVHDASGGEPTAPEQPAGPEAGQAPTQGPDMAALMAGTQ